MFGQINVLLKQALETFSCRREVFHQNLEALKTVMNKVTINDVKLNPILLNNKIWENSDKAPVTYVDIYEDNKLTLGIFILKPGKVLPLHDHPDMHGLIKVLYGKLKITSYSIRGENSTSLEPKSSKENRNRHCILMAEKESEIVADPTNNCCILYPDHKNLHEIHCLEGPAAFMDILSPPYDTQNETGEMRKCNYYQVLTEIAPNIFKIEKTEAPSDFWTDSAPFAGKSSN